MHRKLLLDQDYNIDQRTKIPKMNWDNKIHEMESFRYVYADSVVREIYE